MDSALTERHSAVLDDPDSVSCRSQCRQHTSQDCESQECCQGPWPALLRSAAASENGGLPCCGAAPQLALPIRVRHCHRDYDSFQLCSTISFTLREYSRLFSVYNLAASEFAGEFGFGSHRSDCMDVSIAEMS